MLLVAIVPLLLSGNVYSIPSLGEFAGKAQHAYNSGAFSDVFKRIGVPAVLASAGISCLSKAIYDLYRAKSASQRAKKNKNTTSKEGRKDLKEKWDKAGNAAVKKWVVSSGLIVSGYGWYWYFNK